MSSCFPITVSCLPCVRLPIWRWSPATASSTSQWARNRDLHQPDFNGQLNIEYHSHGPARRSRLRRYDRSSAPWPSSPPQALPVGGTEGEAVVLQCSAQRRDRTNQALRQPESAVPAESRRIEERHGGQQPKPGNSTQDVLPDSRRPNRASNRTAAAICASSATGLRASCRSRSAVLPTPNRSTTLCSSATPSRSVRYMLMPSANSNTGRSAGIRSSQDGSVAGVATRWYRGRVGKSFLRSAITSG